MENEPIRRLWDMQVARHCLITNPFRQPWHPLLQTTTRRIRGIARVWNNYRLRHPWEPCSSRAALNRLVWGMPLRVSMHLNLRSWTTATRSLTIGHLPIQLWRESLKKLTCRRSSSTSNPQVARKEWPRPSSMSPRYCKRASGSTIRNKVANQFSRCKVIIKSKTNWLQRTTWASELVRS